MKNARPGKSDSAAVKELRQRIAELEQEVDEARSAAATASSAGTRDPNEVSAKLRQKAERVTAVAEHLRRRRQRLRKMKLMLLSKGTQRNAAGAADAVEVEQERQQIIELRRLLAASEQTMLRRWARPRAVSSAVWIVVLAVICGGVSWLAASHFFPARMAASVVLQAKTTNGLPMSAEQSAAWHTWHTSLFTDSTFIKTLANRMGERRLDQYSDTG